MQIQKTNSFRIITITCMVLLLSACQSTMRQISDCKQGDWTVIGHKDGENGLPSIYEEKKQFCSHIDSDKIKAESDHLYQLGWNQGNDSFWHKLGNADGFSPKAMSYFSIQSNSEIVIKNKTPLNQNAYNDGWKIGNGAYWRNIGDQDGYSGKPNSIETVRQANAGDIQFNLSAFQEGWRAGNQAYWTHLGYQDAHNGMSDNSLTQHIKLAKQLDVTVRSDAYRAAWNLEIIEYWKKTAWDDATNAWDVTMRKADAKKRDVKFEEAAYLEMWNKRLIQYWTDAGKIDGFGKYNRINERSANVKQDRVFITPEAKTAYLETWSVENARYCSPTNAFDFGRQSQYFELGVCHPTALSRAQNAYRNGQEFQSVRRDLERVERDIQYTLNQRNDAQYRLSQIDRDIRKDLDNKDRPKNADNDNIDRRRDRERSELVRLIHQLNRKLNDLEGWSARYRTTMDQLQFSI